MPSLATLAPESAGEVPCNDDPVLRAEFIDLLEKHGVFLGRPLAARVLRWLAHLRLLGASHELYLQLLNRIEVLLLSLLLHLVPPLEAPDLRLVRHVLAQSVPGVFTVGGHEPFQFFVL